MNMNINAMKTYTDILEKLTTEEIRHALQEDNYISQLTTLDTWVVINKSSSQKELQPNTHLQMTQQS